METRVRNVVVPYRGIARLLDGLDAIEPHHPRSGGLEALESAPEGASTAGAEVAMFTGAAPSKAAPPDEITTFPAGLTEAQRDKLFYDLRVAAAVIARADRTPGILYSPDNEMASLLLGFMTKKAIDEGKLAELPHGGLEAKFDDLNIGGWIGSFVHDWYKRLTNKRAFIGNPETTPVELGKNDVSIAVLGDWGTGLYGAPRCALSILHTRPVYDVVLHLGDVYYAGNTEEVQSRFLDLWPKVPGARSLALNSNHEMYSGGEGYFDLTLPAFRQSSSYFAYQNDHFVLVGLDTGYDEYNLAGNQDGWLDTVVRNAGKRRVVLFSHHQPFSLYESAVMKPQSKLGALLKERKIFAWYWGHEHRCVVYDKHPGWGLQGRCIGHSGYPYFRIDLEKYPLHQVNPDSSAWRQLGMTNGTPGGYILDGQNADVAEDPNRYGPHGYASIHLSGAQLVERIHAADGTILHELTL
ncbi:MAG: metallophosphoesterase [Byssovorax sp.]